jgi:hypothetical protein
MRFVHSAQPSRIETGVWFKVLGVIGKGPVPLCFLFMTKGGVNPADLSIIVSPVARVFMNKGKVEFQNTC